VRLRTTKFAASCCAGQAQISAPEPTFQHFRKFRKRRSPKTWPTHNHWPSYFCWCVRCRCQSSPQCAGGRLPVDVGWRWPATSCSRKHPQVSGSRKSRSDSCRRWWWQFFGALLRRRLRSSCSPPVKKSRPARPIVSAWLITCSRLRALKRKSRTSRELFKNWAAQQWAYRSLSSIQLRRWPSKMPSPPVSTWTRPRGWRRIAVKALRDSLKRQWVEEEDAGCLLPRLDVLTNEFRNVLRWSAR